MFDLRLCLSSEVKQTRIVKHDVMNRHDIVNRHDIMNMDVQKCMYWIITGAILSSTVPNIKSAACNGFDRQLEMFDEYTLKCQP